MNTHHLSGLTCLLWAGLVLGGSLVVAPAKFFVAEVSVQDAVRIGRAQFDWIGIAELAFCLALLLWVLLQGRARNPLQMIPALVFALQCVFVVPALHAGTDHFLATGLRAGGHLHLVYVAMDIVKVASLIWVGMVAMRCAASPGHPVPQRRRSHA
ncbi:MAG: hypothetical protein AAGA94_07470 [Pseudomonadota bacterium]